jgi:hypothetical protein
MGEIWGNTTKFCAPKYFLVYGTAKKCKKKDRRSGLSFWGTN